MRLVGLATAWLVSIGLVGVARRRRWGWRLVVGRKEQRLLRIDRLRPRSVQTLQQRIEALLDLFALAAFATQGAEQLGDHLFEHGGVIGKGCGVDR